MRERNEMSKWWMLRVARIFVFIVAATLVFGVIVRELWNWLMPTLFGLHTITFAQALGIFLLGKIIFGGFHRGGGHRGGRGRGGPWGRQMRERWEGMSEEEREKFRAGMQGRGGWCRPRPVEPVS